MGRRNLIPFYVGMVLVISFIGYLVFETVVRLLRFPDPELYFYLEQQLTDSQQNGQYLSSPMAVYGWDRKIVIASSPNSTTSKHDKPYTILFVGDSVTLGFGVDITNEAYPMLLFHTLNEKMEVRVLNGAVQGFGVDQMIMKLEELVPKHRPDVIVFAYIPHDLWRPARNINYGLLKPVWVTDTSGDWEIVSAPNAKEFYESYANAKRWYYLSLWSLKHVAGNLRYYYPKLYSSHYHLLFQEIRDRLVTLGEKYDTDILMVRLASTWPGTPVPYLDGIARHIFASRSVSGHYRYLDSEQCVRLKSSASGIDYDSEFKYHPSVAGHRIYRDCLIDPLLAISNGQTRSSSLLDKAHALIVSILEESHILGFHMHGKESGA